MPASTRKECKLRTSNGRLLTTLTRGIAGLSALLERFRSTTENRGVPGSSPGLATSSSVWCGASPVSSGAIRGGPLGTRHVGSVPKPVSPTPAPVTPRRRFPTTTRSFRSAALSNAADGQARIVWFRVRVNGSDHGHSGRVSVLPLTRRSDARATCSLVEASASHTAATAARPREQRVDRALQLGRPARSRSFERRPRARGPRSAGARAWAPRSGAACAFGAC